MNYRLEQITYPSKDGKNTVYAEIYVPKDVEPRGIVQLAHGMVDHVGRYHALADFLTASGYIFAGNNHLGHAKTAKPEDYGFFAKKGGCDLVIADLHTMNKYLRGTYPDLPLTLLGHSMGSFITRLYVEKHPHSVNRVIIMGTAGPNSLLPLGLALARVIKTFKGERHHSRTVNKLVFGSYNSRFDSSEGKNAWVSRNTDSVSDRDTSEYTKFSFTVSGYIDLFEMTRKCNKREWFKEYPRELPTLVISGKMDPVGNYGDGPSYVYKQLLIAGADVELKLYEGARHELFSEDNREEIFVDILRWLDK